MSQNQPQRSGTPFVVPPYTSAKPRLPDCPTITGLLVCFPCCLPLTLWGLQIKKHPQIPFDAEKVKADGGTFAVAADGRKIEYFVYGSTSASAPVVVNLHGSGFSGKAEMEFYKPICETLGVKGIAVSWGGHGYTDGQVGRKVADWVKKDLEAVLTNEAVDKFMVTGYSSGNPHALVAAWQFPDRCVGLGLNAPCLSAPICEEFVLKGALGTDSLPTTDDLKKCHNSWYFAMMRTVVGSSCSPGMMISQLAKTNPQIKTDPRFVQWLTDGMARGMVRGAGNTAGWESAFDVCYEWGFDLREIQCNNACVWHSADDHECPPEHGEWLVDMFRAKNGVKVNFNDTAEGWGHFTFYRGEFATAEGSLVKALLDQR